MVIRRLTATFGCLDGAVLELHEGLNLLTLPNESGKSTWTAFLLAMFYGIDTTERSAKGRMAAKLKYQPWNGKPMEGSMEIEHCGKTIVVQRTSQRNKPMSVFRAYDKSTGLELPELTADNCGAYFLGVERSVFRRSAFLSGDELAVTEDEALAQRLENLAASGNLQDNYPAAAAKLKLWKNRCRYHQNGLIPETVAKLEQIRETQAMAAALRQQRLEAGAAWTRCQTQLQAQARTEDARWKQKKAEAAEALASANALAEQTDARVSKLPPEDQLRMWLARLEQPEHEQPGEASCPPALIGISSDAIIPEAERDLRVYTKLRNVRTIGWWLAAAVCAALAAVSFRQSRWLSAALLIFAAACAVGGQFYKAESKKKARKIRESYGGTEILPAAIAWRDVLVSRERARRQDWEAEVLVEQIAEFAPSATNRTEALAALREALTAHRQAAQAQAALERAQLQWQAIQPTRAPALDKQKEHAAALRLQAETLRSREEALGGWERLETKRQKLASELETLERREQALTLAQAALEAAHTQLAQVYAPRLTAMAGAYLQWLTGNRYDGLILQEGYQLLARERATGLTRPLASLSRGAQDQAWLALRLAMTALLLPRDAPVVLDDALATFDADRTASALAALEQEERQVILFRCR